MPPAPCRPRGARRVDLARAKIASSSCSALKPLARRIALRSHCSPNDEQQAADHQTQDLDGQRRERRAEDGHHHDEGEHRRRDSGPRRPPATGDPGRQDDRYGLHALDGTGEEDCDKEQDVATHGHTQLRLVAGVTADAAVRRGFDVEAVTDPHDWSIGALGASTSFTAR